MIIDCQLEDLIKEKDTALRLWLGKNECQTLIKVAEAQAKRFATDAIKESFQAHEENRKIDAANSSLRQAQRWWNFIEVLNSLIEQKTPFQTAKLS